jgi:mannose-6-phosphate isomerase-like protein (cupin superfamily)
VDGSEFMQIVNEKEIQAKDGVKYLIRGPNIDWGVITLKPGEKLSPHLHNEVEETFFVLEGTTTFILKEKELDGSAGMGIRLEPKESHGLKNKGTVPTRMVFIKHIYRPNDKINC